jgi:FkbM family methyltransferase
MAPTSFPGRIIFDHLQKTGGQALASWLRSELGTAGVSPNLIGTHRELINTYGGLHSIITAHVVFSAGEALDPRYQYITCLREPIDRVLSWVFFTLHDALDDPHSRKVREAAKIFLESEGKECPSDVIGTFSNLYVDHFSSIGRPGTVSGNANSISDDEKLARAVAAVQTYDVVGIYEEYPKFISDVASLVCVAAPAEISRVNVSTRRPPVNEVSPAFRDRIAELNQNDFRFYSKIVELNKSKEITTSAVHKPKHQPGWRKSAAAPTFTTLTLPINSAGTLTLMEPVPSMTVAERATLSVSIKNLSGHNWASDTGFPINACYHWLDSSGEVYLYDGVRTQLPKEGVPFGSSVCMDISVAAPSEAGSYTLMLTLVQEGVAWLERKGFLPAIVQVRVEDPAHVVQSDTAPLLDEGDCAQAIEQSLTPEQTINVLYDVLLHRAPDPGGFAANVDLLASGKNTPRGIAERILESREFQGRKPTVSRPGDDFNNVFETLIPFELHGCTVYVGKHSSLADHLRLTGGYEPWVLPYFLEHLRPGMRVLDIGAAWGLFALPSAQRVGPTGAVWAVEISQRNSNVLLRAARANGFNWMHLLPFGVADKMEATFLPVQTTTFNNIVRNPESVNNLDGEALEVVPVLPLDSLRDQLGRIDVIKMDVEGMEYRAILGARRLIEENRPVVFLEYSPMLLRSISRVPAEDLLHHFLDLDYDIEILHRTTPRELLDGRAREATVARVNEAWERHVKEEAGTHLDLRLASRH